MTTLRLEDAWEEHGGGKFSRVLELNFNGQRTNGLIPCSPLTVSRHEYDEVYEEYIQLTPDNLIELRDFLNEVLK